MQASFKWTDERCSYSRGLLQLGNASAHALSTDRDALDRIRDFFVEKGLLGDDAYRMKIFHQAIDLLGRDLSAETFMRLTGCAKRMERKKDPIAIMRADDW